jgi:sRNA-binding regulator protein Hfq
MKDQSDDLLRPLARKRIKAVLRSGLGLVGTLIAVTKHEILIELDTRGRLVVMNHAVEYIEPLGDATA